MRINIIDLVLMMAIVIMLSIAFFVLLGCSAAPQTGISMRTGKMVDIRTAELDYMEWSREAFNEDGTIKPGYVDENGNAVYKPVQ